MDRATRAVALWDSAGRQKDRTFRILALVAGLVTVCATSVSHAQQLLRMDQPEFPVLQPTELPKGLTILPWRLGISSDYDGKSGSDNGSAAKQGEAAKPQPPGRFESTR